MLKIKICSESLINEQYRKSLSSFQFLIFSEKLHLVFGYLQLNWHPAENSYGAFLFICDQQLSEITLSIGISLIAASLLSLDCRSAGTAYVYHVRDPGSKASSLPGDFDPIFAILLGITVSTGHSARAAHPFCHYILLCFLSDLFRAILVQK